MIYFNNFIFYYYILYFRLLFFQPNARAYTGNFFCFISYLIISYNFSVFQNANTATKHFRSIKISLPAITVLNK